MTKKFKNNNSGKIPRSKKNPKSSTMDNVVVQSHYEFSTTVASGADNIKIVTITPTMADFD